jgi:hypothetical protein
MRRVWRDAAFLFGVEELQQACYQCYVTMSLLEDLEASSKAKGCETCLWSVVWLIYDGMLCVGTMSREAFPSVPPQATSDERPSDLPNNLSASAACRTSRTRSIRLREQEVRITSYRHPCPSVPCLAEDMRPEPRLWSPVSLMLFFGLPQSSTPLQSVVVA